jgi:hypothetical protein
MMPPKNDREIPTTSDAQKPFILNIQLKTFHLLKSLSSIANFIKSFLKISKIVELIELFAFINTLLKNLINEKKTLKFAGENFLFNKLAN